MLPCTSVLAAVLASQILIQTQAPPEPDIVDDPSAPVGMEREAAEPPPAGPKPEPIPAAEGPTADGAPLPPPNSAPAMPAAGDAQLPRPARRRGTGLLVSAGILGGLGLVSSIGRVGSINRCANAIGETTDTAAVDELITNGFTTAQSCLAFAAADTGLGALQIGLNGTSFALAAAGGAIHGRAIAIDDIRSGRHRKRAPLAAVGGVLLGVGVVGYIALRVVSIGTFWGIRTGCDGGIYGEELAACMKREYTVRMVGYEAFQASGIVGVSMLANGARYHSVKNGWAAGKEARLSPLLGVDRLGVQFRMRF